jgi:hypothetical protein
MAAVALGIQTGGWAPKDWMTEEGPAPWLEELGLQAAGDGYAVRTLYNVCDSAGTALFGNVSERGSGLTLSMCRRHVRAFIINPTPDELRQFVAQHCANAALNIAGNRESRNPGICQRVINLLLEAFE